MIRTISLIFFLLFCAVPTLATTPRNSLGTIRQEVNNVSDAIAIPIQTLDAQLIEFWRRVVAHEASSPALSESNPAQELQSFDTYWLGFWERADRWAALEEWLGRPVTVAHVKLAFGKAGFSQALNVDQRQKLTEWTALAPHVRISVILDIEPTGDGPRFNEIAAGEWDPELRAVAHRLVETGHEDAILRLWHEPELPFHRWCEDPAYVLAWRYVHEIFTAVEGAAFTWQYSLDGPGGRQLRAEDGQLWIDKCYPGMQYVDQVSVGAYDRHGSDPEDSWENVRAKLAFVRDWAFTHGHHFSIAEWGLWDNRLDCKHNGHGDNPAFIQNAIRFFQAVPREMRGYMLYFNRHACVNIKQFPQARTQFRKHFGIK